MNCSNIARLVTELCDIYMEKTKHLKKEAARWQATSDFWQERYISERALLKKAQEDLLEDLGVLWFSLD